ncbi:MAG TPA: molybdopterin cofactor-binding domain-containing protein, partial [Acetobacteraceae bacterium]
MSQIGRSLRRLEDARFLTGAGRYLDDIELPGMLHAAVVRSPHAHAIIAHIDAAAARAVSGVHGVFTAADLAADKLGPIPCAAQVPTLAPMIVPPRFALAAERVRHVGDPVAFVVADSAAIARDAADLVDVRYDPLPAVTDAVAAMATGAPQLWDEAPGTVSYRFQKGDKTAVDAAFAGAAHVAEVELVNNRLVIAPMETRGAIGVVEDGVLHLIASAAGVHGMRDVLAGIFHVAPDRVRVSAPDVGGGFGIKNAVYPENVMLLWAARRLHRPIKWMADRAEDFASTSQGRDNHTRARLALDADGRFLALDVSTVANLGAYIAGYGPGTSTSAPSTAMGGPYNIQAVFMDVQGVLTNTLPIDAYRGAGKPEANYLTERLIDRAVHLLQADPFELRR